MYPDAKDADSFVNNGRIVIIYWILRKKMKAVEVKNLTFSYDQEKNAADNVTFSVEKGSYTTIIGHNGSGKSTVAKLVAGLFEKKSGTIPARAPWPSFWPVCWRKRAVPLSLTALN